MFRDVLSEIVGKSDGAIGAVLMGSDGISVEQVAVDGAGLDIETVAMEMSVVLREVGRIMKQIEAGRTEELVMRSVGLTAVLRVLTDEYFVALALRPEGNLGKARFLLRGAAPRLLAGL